MGTMLQRHGLKLGEIPELLAITNPDLLTNIHRQYIEAGTEIVYANTFGANRRKMQKTPYTVADVVSAAIAAAKKACIGTSARVALDIGPLGELLEPMGTLPFETAVDMFAEIVDAGVNAGADLICIETMTDLYEAKAALLAAKEHSTLPVWVTMSFDATGRTFTGCTIPSMARTLEGLGADAIGLNCSQGPKQLLPLFQELCRVTTLPVIAKPNAGLPDPVDGHYDLPPEDFASTMVDVVGAGVSIVGGCCGTNPDYIRALHDAVHTMTPGARDIHHGSFLCTPTMPLEISGVRVIGERINPTGKKRFQQALLAGDLDYIVDVAIAQVDAGAQILDVNVGYPGVDEVAMLPRVVRKLQEAVDVPLQLDSTNAAALEAALRVYNGKAAVNSVNGEEKVLQTLLPVVKKYGAAVVGLALDEKGLPKTAAERVATAKRIVDAAERFGIPREDVFIDCLTLTVSAQQDQAEETLAAVRTVHRDMGLQTVLGVSNISFGLPNRLLMTQTFLIRALNEGLTLPIINPNQKEIMDAVAAFRVLSGEDEACAAYVERFGSEAALAAEKRVYNGKAAVNSVNGEEKVLQTLLPVVKKYGAAVVGLALDEKGLPKTAAERVATAKRIVDAAERFGIPREDVFIDCLTLTVSAQQDQAEETLAAVRTVHRDMGLQTVLGVSNISFGLPNRLLMTQTFLIRALNEGLTLPIINPNQKEIMDAVAAFRVLSGEDEACAAYVERFGSEAALAAEKQRAAAVSSAPTAKAAAVTNLDDAIIRGLKADAARLAKEALATENELSLVEKHLIPALDKVGTDYERGVAFLPQLLGAAQAAQAVFSVIRDSLAAKGGEPVKKGRIVIATVKGDIHDIGKNIVRTVLENYGYDVLDLGRDVPPETVVDAVVKENIRLVGLSALMTTTLPSMEETVRQLHTLPNPPSIMVGGAVVTPEYAQKMGAFYAKDARASVEIAKKVLG